ncbi:MAG: hypothetical protein HPY71_01625 [Firmicutes bacterium]|nr:hypothetical protein [Bacillota bacterium]
MPYSFSEDFARNLAESIRRTARDKEYIRWALDARKQYVDLRLNQDPEIRRLYISAARRAGQLVRSRFRWPSDILLRRRLRQLRTGLEEIAQQFNEDFTGALKTHIVKAVTAGTGYSKAVTLSLVKTAGWNTAPIHEVFAQVNRQAVEACWTRTRKGLFLSDRIWQQAERVRDSMRDIIQEAVVLGIDAKDVARMLERYVERGAKTFAWQYPDMIARMEGRIPKDLTYEGLRLARTEMTAAFGEGTISAARVSPSYQGMQWILSKAHPIEDICDTLAEADYFGLGAGVYSPGNEPMYPAHPNCLCVLVPKHETPEEFVERLRRWRENPASEPGLEEWYNNIYRSGIRVRESGDHGKGPAGRPNLYVDVPDLPEPAKIGLVGAWDDAQKYGLANGKEVLLHVDASTGKQMISRVEGEKSSVAFRPDIHDFLLNAAAESVLSVHNHPSSSSFSAEDLNTLCMYPSIKYMTVVGHDGTRYLVKVGKGKRPGWREIVYKWTQARDKDYDYFWNKVHSGEMTPEQAWYQHSHLTMEEVAKEFGWEYRRVGPNES